MPTRVSEVVLKYSVDDPSASKTQRKAEAINKTIADPRAPAAIENLGEQFAIAAKKAGNLEQQSKDLLDTLHAIGATEDEIAANVKQFDALTKSAKEATEQIERAGKASEKTGGVAAAASRAGSSPSKGGDGGALVGAVQRAAGSVGLQPLADVAGVVDDFSSLGVALAAAGISAGVLATAVGVAAVGLVPLAIAVKQFLDLIQAGRTGVDSAIVGLDAYYAAVASGTTETIEAQLKQLEIQREVNQTYKDQLDAQIASAKAQGAAGLFIDQLTSKADDLGKAISDADQQMFHLNNALSSTAVQARDAAAALEGAQAEQVASAEKAAQEQIKIAALLRTGTSEQIKAMTDNIGDQLRAANDQLLALQSIEDPTEATKQSIEDLKAKLNDLNAENRSLVFSVLPVIKAREDEAKAADALKATLQGLIGASDDTLRSIGELGQELLEGVSKGGEDRRKAELKAGEEITKAVNDSLEKKATLEQRYADKQIEIVQSAVDAAEKALSDLEKQRDSLRKDSGRAGEAADRKFRDQELTDKIEAQRTEAKELRAHLQNLQKIRDSAQLTEFQQGLDRDFGGLLLTRLGVNAQLRQANQDFTAGRNERGISAQETREDAERNREIERREARITLAQRLDDARQAYLAERAEIDAQRTASLAKTREAQARETAEMQSNLAKQIAARRNGLQQEITLINQGVAQRIKAEAQAQTSLIQNASRTAGIVTSILNAINPFKAPVKRDMGGPLSAGMLATVNEPTSSGNESWVSGGKRYALPQNSLFMPSRSGYVDSGRGSGGKSIGTLNMPITVSGAGNPQATAEYVAKEVTRQIKYIFDA